MQLIVLGARPKNGCLAHSGAERTAEGAAGLRENRGGARQTSEREKTRARRKARVGFPGTSGAHIDRGPSPDQETVRVHPPIY